MWRDKSLPLEERLEGGRARLLIDMSGTDHSSKYLYVDTLLKIYEYVCGN